MRYITFILLLTWGLVACQGEDNGFDFSVSGEEFSFKAIPGGAVMYYQLPDDEDIFAVNVRYTDAQGENCLKVGGYGSDSLVLDGFNEARQGVPAHVSFVNERNEESKSIELTFDTQESAAYAFFNNAEVSPYWDGFQVIYKAPEQVAGMVHVFYLGTNPLTQQPDTILMKSFPITQGGDTLLFPLEQKREMNTVIIRTEDFRGYRVRQKIWENVESYQVEKMELTPNEFIDVKKLSIEDNEDMAGVKYLFDGDIKGTQRMNTHKSAKVYTFVAGPGAVGSPFIIDLKGDRVPARIRLYGILNIKGLYYTAFDFWTGKPESPLATIWNANIMSKMPCAVTVYGGNDKDGDEASWTKLGSFYESPSTAANDRWCAKCVSSEYQFATLDEMNAAEPDYLEVLFPAMPVTYRYLKLVVEDTFYATYASQDQNTGNYVTMHELEVYVKKD